MNNPSPQDNLPDKNLRSNSFNSNETALSDIHYKLESSDSPSISSLTETFAQPETCRSKHIPSPQETKTAAATSNTLNPSLNQQHAVADADSNNWVDRFAPGAIRPYLQLMRADRPVGIWLFFLPLCCSLALAAEPGQPPSLRLMLLFFIFATAMRGAGCTINDMIDRDLDSQVERTRSRPIPSGQVTAELPYHGEVTVCSVVERSTRSSDGILTLKAIPMH
ncbi:MAG: UbiA family prenyltransferase [Cyanobacteria bacterium P01_D01_bin.44]